MVEPKSAKHTPLPSLLLRIGDLPVEGRLAHDLGPAAHHLDLRDHADGGAHGVHPADGKLCSNTRQAQDNKRKKMFKKTLSAI